MNFVGVVLFFERKGKAAIMNVGTPFYMAPEVVSKGRRHVAKYGKAAVVFPRSSDVGDVNLRTTVRRADEGVPFLGAALTASKPGLPWTMTRPCPKHFHHIYANYYAAVGTVILRLDHR
jgi:serine/threonine protein kinase